MTKPVEHVSPSTRARFVNRLASRVDRRCATGPGSELSISDARVSLRYLRALRDEQRLRLRRDQRRPRPWTSMNISTAAPRNAAAVGSGTMRIAVICVDQTSVADTNS